MAGHIVVFILRVYRAVLSPFLTALCGGLGVGCRFTPTCSQYAIEAVQRHGVLKGFMLTANRLARCHPWGGSGHDPVPVGRICNPTIPQVCNSASHLTHDCATTDRNMTRAGLETRPTGAHL